jgi:MFS family permease
MVALLWAVIPLLLALAWAGDRFPWVSVPIGALLGTAGLGLFAFIAIERGAADPVLPLSLFRERTFVVASVAAFFMGMGLFGALSYMPLFIQGVLGASATNSGLVNMPLMLGFTAASFASGMVASRTHRYRWMVIAGCLVMAGGMVVMATLDEQARLALPIVGMIVVGLGLGLSMPLLGLAVQNALDDRLLGVATASSQFFRQIGGTLGIALFGTIITTQIRGGLVGRLPEEVTSVAPPEALRQLEEPRILLSPEALERLRGTFVSFGDGGPALYDQTLAVMRSVLADGLHEVFLVGLLVAFLTLAVSVFLPERPLRTRALVGQERAPAASDLIWGDASLIGEGRTLHEVPVDEAPIRAATVPQAGEAGDS